MKFLEKIKSKNILPFLLSLIMLINYLPLIINGGFNKNVFEVYTAGTKELAICFIIEFIILILFFIKKIKLNKLTIINFILLVLTSISLLIVQINNYKSGTYMLFDFINIGCIFANVLFLFVLMLNLHIDEKYVYTFFKGMVAIGLFACILNCIIYKEQILSLFADKAQLRNIRSFFPHRNQFAMVLYVMAILDMFLVLKYNKNILYKIILIFFLVNMLFTASRTAILATGIFAVIFFITTDRFSIITKLILTIVGIEAILAGAYFLSIKYPEKIENVKNIFIRSQDLNTFNGRTEIWDAGINLISENDNTKMFGKGRFLGIELVETKEGYSHFHSFYIETLVTGGIMELVYFLSIYLTVIVKVFLSGMEKKYKSIYISMFISFFIYCTFEPLGRFSIGSVDALCMVCFIAIPLIHANSVEKIKKYKVSRKWLLDKNNVIIENQAKEGDNENEKNEGNI